LRIKGVLEIEEEVAVEGGNEKEVIAGVEVEKHVDPRFEARKMEEEKKKRRMVEENRGGWRMRGAKRQALSVGKHVEMTRALPLFAALF